MRLTDNPCKDCIKRTAECRLSCARFKVYDAAKRKEYEKHRIEAQRNSDIYGYIRDTIRKRKKGSIKYTPPKNEGNK